VTSSPHPVLSTPDPVRTRVGASTVALASRAWYGSLQLLPVEFLVAMQPLGIANFPRRIHSRVADANVILNEIAAQVRLEKQVALLAAVRDGGLRLHVASAIPDEVETHIAQRAARQGLNAARLEAIWRRDLAPRLRVVDVGEPDRLELAAVTARDETDLPTAALATILGPGSTWSSDRDLIDPGLAEPYVLELVIAIRDVCLLDARVYTTARGAEIIAALGAELVRAIARLDARARLATGVLVLAALTAAMVIIWRKPQLREDLTEMLQRICAAVVEELARGYALQKEAIAKVPAPLEMDTDRPERAIARVLASAPAPLASDEITMLVRRFHVGLEASGVRRALNEHQMFVRAGRGYWQFGRSRPVRVVA
jgi:hypothetical protein